MHTNIQNYFFFKWLKILSRMHSIDEKTFDNKDIYITNIFVYNK